MAKMSIQLAYSQETPPTSYLILPVAQDPFLRSALQSPRPKEMFEASLLHTIEQATNSPSYSSISSSSSSTKSIPTSSSSSSSSGRPYFSSFSTLASTETQSYFPMT
ncbi:hypothetical protein BGZ92_009310 [Podila epicladia]|nr:hypothetical protein BGZ92_009310 [Podila epicladia]